MRPLLAVAILALTGSLYAQETSPEADAQGKPVSILMIGNSMTHNAGNVGRIACAMLAKKGYRPTLQQVLAPGENLAGHWATEHGEVASNWKDQFKSASKGDAEAYQKRLDDRLSDAQARKGRIARIAAERPWDYVVLQTSSREPERPDYFETPQHAELLTKLIVEHSPKSRILLYVPGGTPREIGNAGDHEKTTEYNAQALALRTQLLEQQAFHAALPVIEALTEAAKNPAFKLRVSPSDGHYSFDSAYLVACLLCAEVTGESAEGLAWRLKMRPLGELQELPRENGLVFFPMTAEKAALLQAIAAKCHTIKTARAP